MVYLSVFDVDGFLLRRHATGINSEQGKIRSVVNKVNVEMGLD